MTYYIRYDITNRMIVYVLLFLVSVYLVYVHLLHIDLHKGYEFIFKSTRII